MIFLQKIKLTRLDYIISSNLFRSIISLDIIHLDLDVVIWRYNGG